MSEPKVYRIPVTWQVFAEIEVKASSLQLALELAANAAPVPGQPQMLQRTSVPTLYRDFDSWQYPAISPVDDSLTVDLEGVAIRYPDEKHGQERIVARVPSCPTHGTTLVLYCPSCRGAVTSERKARSSAENGKKGGRPRKSSGQQDKENR